jgi:REP element-mobilizing transposase RayT
MKTYPNRKPNRLREYDYASNGVYFITICTKDRQHLLSSIVGAATCRPNDSGYMTEHGEPIPCRIVLSESGMIVDAAIRELSTHYRNVNVDRYVVMPNHVHILLRIGETDGRQVAAPTMIGSLKRHVSIAIGSPIWQKGFYDHVIRGEEDYLLHCRYIDENPWKWLLGKDEYA